MSFIEQYLEIKNQHRDSIVLFQLGQFYQMYYHDAELAQELLHLKLTSRSIGDRVRIPMCGIPANVLDRNLAALSEKGYRTVVCSQFSENNQTVRKIDRVAEPEGEKIDLTEAWDNYLLQKQFLPSPVQKRPAAKQLLEERLKALDLASITPMQALELLHEWKSELSVL